MSEPRWVPLDLSDPADADTHLRGDPAALVDALAFVEKLLRRPAWHADAACRGQGPRTWFPTRGETSTAAKAICAGCPVRAECLDTAMAEPSTDGIWGGTAKDERKGMRRDAA